MGVRNAQDAPIATAVGISLAVLVWNETVVPYASRMFQYVNNVEIRKREVRGILSDREIWYHGAMGFYHIDYIDRARNTIHGMQIYRFDDDFQLLGVVQIPQVEWQTQSWKTIGTIRHQVLDGESTPTSLNAAEITIPETLEDFLDVDRQPEELSFAVLRQRTINLTNKGIDASHYMVELHQKLAVPFASTVLALIAIPIGGRLRRHPSVASIVAVGMAIGFGYWVILGLAGSLGQTGAIPAPLAAWVANGVYLLLAVFLFLSWHRSCVEPCRRRNLCRLQPRGA